MLSTTIKKIIARDGERKFVESSWEEMQKFITNGERPDFDDKSVLCVRFLICDSEELETADTTSWYVNPIYTSALERNLSKFPSEEDIWEHQMEEHSYEECYSPKMCPDFLPELLLITPLPGQDDIFSLYSSFYFTLILTNETTLTDEEKFERFIQYLEEENLVKKPCNPCSPDSDD